MCRTLRGDRAEAMTVFTPASGRQHNASAVWSLTFFESFRRVPSRSIATSWIVGGAGIPVRLRNCRRMGGLRPVGAARPGCYRPCPMSGPVPLDHTSFPRPRRRVQEAGLVIVILLLGAALTFLSEPIY